jgi:hypothetical protein
MEQEQLAMSTQREDTKFNGNNYCIDTYSRCRNNNFNTDITYHINKAKGKQLTIENEELQL